MPWPISRADLQQVTTTVREIVRFKCSGSGCHNEREPYLLDDEHLYTTLTTYRSQGCENNLLVTPCDPQKSAIYRVQSVGGCGTIPQMPKGCEYPYCLPESYVMAIKQWIANGARKD